MSIINRIPIIDPAIIVLLSLEKLDGARVPGCRGLKSYRALARRRNRAAVGWWLQECSFILGKAVVVSVVRRSLV